MKQNRKIRRCLACLLSIVLIAETFSVCASAIDMPADSWKKSEELEDTGLTGLILADPSMERSAISGQMTTAISAIKDELTESDPDEVILMRNWGQLLVLADWLTNNCYVSEESGSAVSVMDGDEAIKTVLEDMATVASSISYELSEAEGHTDEYPISLTGAMSVSIPSDVDNLNDIIGTDKYREALIKLLNEYVEAGYTSVMSSVQGGSFSFNEEYIKAALPEDGSTPYVADGLINEFGSVRGTLAKYHEVYTTVFDKYYGNRLVTVIKSTDAITGYTRSHNFIDVIDSEISDVAKTINFWMSYDNSGTQSTGDTTDGFAYVDAASDALTAMSNAYIVNNNVVLKEEGNPELTDLGYYVLAAGLSYDPFVSFAGNDSYLALLRHFMKNTDKQDELINTLKVAINTKKPLYVTEGARDEWTTSDVVASVELANYRDARLSDILHDDVAVTRAYCVVKGKMMTSAVDASTWDYVLGGSGTSSHTESEAAIADESSTSNATGDVKAGTIEEGQMRRTAGMQEILAAGSEMSLPVMYTTGNEWKFFDANADYLPARIGGMTTVILTNAAKDCKDNKFIQQAGDELLFINGLGDIVLSNGLIVLPAIANPILYEYTTYDVSGEKLETNSDALQADDGGIYLDDKTGYYPYTASFLNHYPAARFNSKDEVVVTNKNDEGKYVLSYQAGKFEASEIYTTGDKRVDVGDITTLHTVQVAGNTFNVRDDEDDVVNVMPFLKQSDNGIYALRKLDFLGQAFAERYFQAYANVKNGDYIPYFPLSSDSSDLLDSYFGQAGPLVTSAVR